VSKLGKKSILNSLFIKNSTGLKLSLQQKPIDLISPGFNPPQLAAIKVS